MERFIPTINETFTNNKGQYFDNIREVRYEKDKTYNSFGTLIGESGSNSGDLDGVYVYRSYIDPNKAYRIYKDQLYSTYFIYRDEYFISKLKEYGKDVKLSELPTGVVTIEGRTIGQEVPYIDGPTLKEYATKETNHILPTKIYIQMLNIIKELYDNEIYYHDIHERNFKIKNNILSIIDFEEQFVKLGYLTDSTKKLIFDYLTMTFNELNEKFNVDYKFERIGDFDDGYQKVLRLEEKLMHHGYKNFK